MSGQPPGDRWLEELVARDHPPCPACRHRLDAVTPAIGGRGRGPRCPHCRAELACSLDSRGAGGGPWLAGMLAAALCSGFYVLTAPMVVQGFMRGNPPPMDFFGIWGGALVVDLTLMLAWLAGRHRIRRWPRWTTLLAAAGTLIAGLGGIALLAMR